MIEIKIHEKHVFVILFTLFLFSLLLVIPTISAMAVVENPGHSPNRVSWGAEPVTSVITVDGSHNGVTIYENGTICLEESIDTSMNLDGCIDSWKDLGPYVVETVD